MAAPKDPIKNAEWRRKLSEVNKGKKRSEESRKKQGDSNKGKKRPPFSEEWREKISISHLGKRNPFYGKHHSEEVCKKISDTGRGKHLQCGKRNPFYGKHHSEEARRENSEAHLGEKSSAWRGGISFEPYCQKFNKEFKERVRAFFGYTCVECGTPQNGTNLSVHHVNFNKMSCCDETTPIFIPLCHSCHSKTNGNRQYWEGHFTEMIEGYYGGKSYLTIEEMVALTQEVP